MAKRKAYAPGDSDTGSDMDMSQSEEEQIEMDVDEDPDHQDLDEVDVTVEDQEDERHEGPVDDKDVMEEEDLEETSDVDVLSSPPPEQHEPEPVPQPRLKIKLKLPQFSAASSAAQSSFSTPNGVAKSSHRELSRDIDLESEDSDTTEQSTRSTSVATTATGGRALTARQAVLANVVDSSHVSLVEPPNPRKKKPLTEIEIALKREETARKRRNLTEKKLEDEKAETINRLLKKQSRSKGKKNALSTAEDRPTPGLNTLVDGDVEEGEFSNVVPVVPTMYRWVSSVKECGDIDNGAAGKQMVLSFAIPPAAVVSQPADTKTEVDHSGVHEGQVGSHLQCDVYGCTAHRKYRLVKDFRRGACGLDHLKELQAQLNVV